MGIAVLIGGALFYPLISPASHQKSSGPQDGTRCAHRTLTHRSGLSGAERRHVPVELQLLRRRQPSTQLAALAHAKRVHLCGDGCVGVAGLVRRVRLFPEILALVGMRVRR